MMRTGSSQGCGLRERLRPAGARVAVRVVAKPLVRIQSRSRIQCRAEGESSTPNPRATDAEEPSSQAAAQSGPAPSSGAKAGADALVLWENPTGSIGLALLFCALVGYAAFLAPNQTPYRDEIFLQKLVGLSVNDVNTVFASLFMLMGIWPATYASLLLPTGRNGTKLGGKAVPAWPFVSLSFAFGIFALLPYFMTWMPDKSRRGPPTAAEIEETPVLRVTESKIAAVLLLAGAAWYLFAALTAGVPAWNLYIKLFDESRFVHVTSIDFLCCCAFAPFWMYHDATARNWQQRAAALLLVSESDVVPRRRWGAMEDWEMRDSLLPVLSALPLLGPLVYLVLRPQGGKE